MAGYSSSDRKRPSSSRAPSSPSGGSVGVPASLAPYLRVGTCSWKYDSWKGLYYDAEKTYRPDDYLSDYARHLDSVEVDQWFWSLFPGGVKLPDKRTVETYASSVPDDFMFTVKAPNALTLTHYYARQPSRYAAFAGEPNPHFLDADLMGRFVERLSPLGRKLGPIMFQFEYLNRKKMPSRDVFIERFGEFIERAPQGLEYACETRNPNYLSRPLFDFLEERKIGFVYLEGYYMPPIREVFERFGPVTAGSNVIRLHGGDRLEIEQATADVWNRIVAPKPDGIEAAVRIVRENARRGVRTFLNVNNHFEGSAPLTVARFLEALRREVR
jgi:uncharacterized protein YecE (DUF72 family)